MLVAVVGGEHRSEVSVMRHRVLLVREWDVQMGSSGCCGRLGGPASDLCEADSFSRARVGMEAMGAVYRALLAEFGDERLELTVVDPRNTAAIVPIIYRDARRRGLSVRQALQQVRRGVATGAVVLDGKVLRSGGLPTPDEAVAAVRAELAALS